MLTAYRCGSCSTTWNAVERPRECIKCQSRLIERSDAPGSSSTRQFGPSFKPTSSTMGTVQRSPAFAITSWIGWGLIIIGFALVLTNDQEVAPIGAIAVFFGFGSLIAAWIISLMKLYLAWSLIQRLREYDPTEINMPTPGKAVGLLFVPFFGMYWIFVAYAGIAKRFNKFVAFENIEGVSPMNEGMFMTYSVLSVLMLVPVLNYLCMLAAPIVYFLVVQNLDKSSAELKSVQADPSTVAW